MELRVLRYFLTVAKEQSFTKAAEQLHITQPTLSRQLAAREEDFFIAAGRFEQAGYAAAKEALGRGDRPTAFIAAYDEVAFGAIRAFAESGLRVPEDLSIIGINDVPTASFAPAALTTIHAYVGEACGQAVDILLRKTADPDYRMVQRILVQCRLIPRETTGPARTL